MSNPIKYSDLFQDDGGVDKLISKINQLEQVYKGMIDTNIKEAKRLEEAAKGFNIGSPDAAKKIAELEKAVQKLTLSQTKNKKATDEINKLREKANQLKTNEAKITQSLKVEIQETTKANKQEAREKLGLVGAYERQSRTLNELRKRYKDLAVEGRANSKESRVLLQEITKLDTKLKSVDATVGQNQRSVGNYRKAFEGLRGALMQGLGALGITAGLVGLTKVIKGAIGVFSSFEKANSTLSAVLGATEKQMAELSAQAKILGATTAFTATQVTELQTEFAKLGFPTEDIQNMTESTLNAAAAMGSDLAETAKLTGATLKAFGLDSTEAARVNDVLAKSTTASALDFQKLSASMSTIAPVANSFGFSVEETTALLGQLSNAGFDASSSATATRNILLNLADSNGKLAKSLKEPVTDLPSLVKGLKQLKDEGIDLGTALELTDKRSVAAFSTFLNGTDDVLALNDALLNAGGTAQKMADIQLDNLSGAITILNSAWEGFILGLEDGDGLLNKFLRGIVDGTTKLLGFVTNTEKVSDTLENERIGLFTVRGELNSVNTTTERRIEIINELKKQYPKYLENINVETASNEDLNKSLEAINKSLVNRIQLQIKQEAIDEQARKVAELEIEFRNRRIALFKAEGKAVEDSRKLQEKANAILNDQSLTDVERGEKLLKLLDDRSKGLKVLSQSTGLYAGAAQSTTNSVEKLQQRLSAFKDIESQLAKEQEALNMLTQDQIGLSDELGESISKNGKSTSDSNKEDAIRLGLIESINEKIKELNKEQEKTNDAARILEINKELETQKKLREDLLGITEENRLKAIKEENEKILKANEDLINAIEELENDALVRSLKSEEEKEIASLEFKQNARRSEIEDSIADEELKQRALLELEQQTADEKEAIRKKFADKEAKENEELEKKKRAENQETQKRIINGALDTLDRINQAEQDRIDKQIEAEKNQISTQQQLAADGLENTLAFEEGELAKLEQKKLEADRKAIRLEKVKALYSAYSAAAGSGDNQAILKVLKDFAIIQGLESTLTSFGTGTGEYGTFGDALDTKGNKSKGGNSLQNGIFKGESHKGRKGGIPVLVEREEGLLSRSQMGALGKDNFVQLTRALDSGVLGSDIFGTQISLVPKINSVNVDFSSLKNEMKEVKRAIQDKPVQQVNVESFANSYTDFVDTKIQGNKKTINRYRVNKKGL